MNVKARVVARARRRHMRLPPLRISIGLAFVLLVLQYAALIDRVHDGSGGEVPAPFDACAAPPSPPLAASLIVALPHGEWPADAVVASWLKVTGLDEIIVVLWGGCRPHKAVPQTAMPRLRLLCAPDEPRWHRVG